MGNLKATKIELGDKIEDENLTFRQVCEIEHQYGADPNYRIHFILDKTPAEGLHPGSFWVRTVRAGDQVPVECKETPKRLRDKALRIRGDRASKAIEEIMATVKRDRENKT